MTDPFISRAKEHIRQGRKAEARRLLHDYVALYSNNVEAWLLLTAIASPHASLEYARKALALDPENPIIQRAVAWAESRLPKPEFRLELPAVAAANPEPKAQTPSASTPTPQPPNRPLRPHPLTASPSAPRRGGSSKPSRLANYVSRFLPVLVVFLSLCLVTGFIIVNNTRADSSIPRLVAQVGDLQKATLTHTPTHTATATPTTTFTPTATATSTPTATPTATPTDTPTFTPTPTFTFTPTFTATNTPWPTNTPIPPTPAPPTATPAPPVAGVGRWIEVNLTRQTLTAWEGQTPVSTFVISSGKWSTQTLPGTFRIYVKLRVGRMVGIDYDTPDVPYIMYYDGDFAIHGAYWHNSFGTPVSHGCVNMKVGEAAWLFDWASVGTVVKIHY